MGIRKQTVIKILREEGVPIRFQSLTEAQRVKSVQRDQAGESIPEMATRLGCDFETVRQTLIDEGTERRPPTVLTAAETAEAPEPSTGHYTC